MSRRREVGKRIRTMRMSRSMSQGDLANALHCGQSTIAMYESGQRMPDMDTLEYLADIFNVPPYSILYDESEIRSMIGIPDDDKLWEKREALRRDPNRRMLFSLAKYGTDEEVNATVKLIDALKATNPDFYDGDDPA